MTGLSKTDARRCAWAARRRQQAPVLQPVLEYRLLLDDGTDAALKRIGQLRMLEEEDPALHLVWNALLRGDSRAADGAGADGDFAEAD